MFAFRPLHVVALAGTFAVLVLAGCSTGGADTDVDAPVATATQVTDATGEQGADAGEASAPAEEGAEAGGDRPAAIDASLPVPPGTLLSETQEASAWEYIYGDVTSDEARAFADELEAMGFEVKVTVDSDGVEQWYLQSADWAIKLEQTHAEESLLYWIDPILE
jgi:hypothetical protein